MRFIFPRYIAVKSSTCKAFLSKYYILLASRHLAGTKKNTTE